MVKSACSVGDPGSIPGLGRSPGEGNGSPLQYCNLENPMDRVVWQATVHGVTKSWTWLSDFTILLIYSLSVIVFLDHLCYFLFLNQLRGLYFILLKEKVLSCIKHQGGVGCAARSVPPCVLPVHVCVLPSVAVITVERCAGRAAPEPGEGQRPREDRVCLSAALVVSRNCEE